MLKFTRIEQNRFTSYHWNLISVNLNADSPLFLFFLCDLAEFLGRTLDIYCHTTIFPKVYFWCISDIYVIKAVSAFPLIFFSLGICLGSKIIFLWSFSYTHYIFKALLVVGCINPSHLTINQITSFSWLISCWVYFVKGSLIL